MTAPALLPGPAAADEPAPTTDGEHLDAFVDEQMERADIPGVAYAVVGPDGVEHQATMGVDGDGEPVTAETPFLWGSVAKPATASLVVLMAEAGELALDDPVTAYLPDFRMADQDASDRITLRHLLNQTSGIPERMDLTDSFEPDGRPGDVVPQLADVELEGEVGEEHVYSSLNYMLLGAVVEEVTGRPFADALQARLLEPAGMTTAITTTEAAAERLPPGHRYVLGAAQPFTTDFGPAGLSSGYLAGSLDDAVAFARTQLTGGSVLTDELRSQLHTEEVRTDSDQGYGLGWRTWQVFGADTPMVWHAGAAPGYQASIVLLPEQGLAIVVLQNVYGTFQESQLLDTSWGIASLLTGAEPELHPRDSMYVALLGGLGGVVLVLVALIGHAAWRVARPRPRRSGRRTTIGLVVWLLGLAVTAGGLLALPGVFGVRLGQVSLWAPDVAALLIAGLVAVALLAVLRVAAGLRTLRIG